MIIVTGANGFIGSALVWFLNQAGEKDIIAVDLVPLTERPQLLKSLSYSKFLLADELWPWLEANSKSVSWVYHMGACSSTTELNWDYLKKVNVEYTQRLFKWCTDHSVGLIYASSAATYGDGNLGFSDQKDPAEFSPLNPYGKSKLVVDQWVLNQNKTPPHWYGLRFFNVFGPNEYYKDDMASVVFKAFNQITNKGSLGLFRSAHQDYGDGEQMRDFVYVKDVCRWMLELSQVKPKNGIYNMGFGKARTWLDLARATFKSMGKTLKIDWIDIPDHLKQRYQYFTEADMSTWKSLGLSDPRWSLEEGVADYINLLSESDPHLK